MNRQMQFTNPLLARKILAVLFFISGYSSLVYQTVWQRILTQHLGADSYSIIFIVAIFLAGLSIGSLAITKINFQNLRTLALTYAGLEICISLYGIISIPLLRQISLFILEQHTTSLWSQLGIYGLVLLLPTVFMGMTGPLVIQLAQNQQENIGKNTGFFYGMNIFGAATGALMTGLIMIEILGLQGCSILSAGMNLVLVGLAFVLLRKNIKNVSIKKQDIRITRTKYSIIIAAVIFGFATIGYELLLFRVLQNYLTLSAMTFVITISIFLTYMAIGQYLGGFLSDKYLSKIGYLPLILVTCGNFLFCLTLMIPPSIFAILKWVPFTSFSSPLISFSHSLSPTILGSLAIALIMMVGVLPLSSLFPIIMRMKANDTNIAGYSFGIIYGLYTIGNIFGCILTGLVFFEYLGTASTFKLLFLMTTLGAIFLALNHYKNTQMNYSISIGCVILCFISFILLPKNYFSLFKFDRYIPEDIIEGKSGVVTVVPTNRFYKIIDVFRTASASAIVHHPSSTDHQEAYRWNFSELMLLDPSFRPKKILIIGLGHGYLPLALLDYPFVEEIIIVDISSEIIQAVKKHSFAPIQKIFKDKRIKIVIEDGRSFIKKSIIMGKKFDLIQNKINEPWTSDCSMLFSIEFFKDIQKLLNNKGYYAVRPHEPHLVSGLQIFPKAIFTGFYHLYFSKSSAPIDSSRISNKDPIIMKNFTRLFPAENNFDQQRSKFPSIKYQEYFPDSQTLSHRVNTDNYPIYEFNYVSKLLGRDPFNWSYIEFDDRQKEVKLY